MPDVKVPASAQEDKADDVAPSSVIRRETQSRDHFEAFKDLIDRKTEGGIKQIEAAIFAHSQPDPDAIGSMMGMQWLLLKAFGIHSQLFYQGEISHPQNNAVCNLLEPQLKKADEEYVPALYDLNILVDTIPSNAGTGGHKVNFDMVLDHHKDLPNGGYSGLVIHMKVGSATAIVYRLMEHFCKDCWFEDDNDLDSKIATAMIAGIMTDCEFLIGDDATEYDSEARNGLWPFRNSNSLKQIVFFKRPRFWVDVKAAACQNVDIDDEGFAIIGLGLIPEKQRDLIADMAEEMVSWVSVETAIAFAVVGGDRIEGSVRSLNSSLTVSDFCKKLGGKHGAGGGKHGKGAYRYSLAGMSIDPDEEEDVKGRTWELIKEKESKRIARLVKK